jgi:hypothetical protein
MRTESKARSLTLWRALSVLAILTALVGMAKCAMSTLIAAGDESLTDTDVHALREIDQIVRSAVEGGVTTSGVREAMSATGREAMDSLAERLKGRSIGHHWPDFQKDIDKLLRIAQRAAGASPTERANLRARIEDWLKLLEDLKWDELSRELREQA